MHYIVVGISTNSDVELNDEVKSLLPAHRTFSGRQKHYELIKDYLPEDHQWIEIKDDMQEVLEEYKKANEPVVVFTSGDPLFYGVANTLKKLQPEVALKVYPYFNSIQLLCHKCNIAYQNSWNTSVHDRSWDELDIALIYQKELIGVLTDAEKNPTMIAQRMLTYGFDNYKIVVGEALDSKAESIKSLSLQQAAYMRFNPLNSVLLVKIAHRKKVFGIADEDFNINEDILNLVTPKAVRLLNMSQLDLYNRKSFWDIGFGAGSMSIEVKKQFPFLNVFSFEKREACDALLEENSMKHSTPGLTKVIADIIGCDLSIIAPPDALFLGEQDYNQAELLTQLDGYLLPKARLVTNTYKEEDTLRLLEIFKQLGYRILEPVSLKINGDATISILTAEKK